MCVSFSPSNYVIADTMHLVLASILRNHPLGGNALENQLQSGLTVCVKIDSQNVDADPEIDCSRYSRVVIKFGCNKYLKCGQLDEDLFYKHMCHELTHLIDRLDSSFGITDDKEQYAQHISQGLLPPIYMDLWNLYINGRLERKGIKVESFEEFKRKRFGRRLCLGLINDTALEPYGVAFDSDRLTFDDIISLTKEAKDLLSSPSSNTG